MKKLSLLALAALFASSAAYAVDVTNNFNVSINFTGSCRVKTAATNIAFTYAAFDTAKTGSTSTVFECSRGLTPTFKLDNTGATQTGSAAAALGAAISGEGLISGIRYTLSGTSAKAAGTAAAAGAGGTGGVDGTADEYTVSITADIAAGQAGTGLGGAAVSQTRVLTITY